MTIWVATAVEMATTIRVSVCLKLATELRGPATLGDAAVPSSHFRPQSGRSAFGRYRPAELAPLLRPHRAVANVIREEDVTEAQDNACRHPRQRAQYRGYCGDNVSIGKKLNLRR